MTTIAICTPNPGTITAACTRAIMAAQGACQAQARPWNFLHVDVESIIVGKARTMLTRTALDASADVIFMVDEDVVIPPHAIVALMDRELPIVGGLYMSRRPPHLPQIYTTEGTEGYAVGARVTPRDVYWPTIEYPATPDLFEVDAIGGGCLMVQREVFEELERRQVVQDEELDHLLRRIRVGLNEDELALLREHVRILDPWFEFLNDEGEDMYFCRKARGAGYKIYADLSVKCYHLGVVPIEEGHFLYIKPTLRRVGEDEGRQTIHDTGANQGGS